MKFGVTMPNRGPLATPETMKEIAQKAEQIANSRA